MHSCTYFVVDKRAHWNNIAQEACLSCTELFSTLQGFNLDYSLLPRGNFEGCRGGPCLHPDCLLLAVGCSSKCINLTMCISGGFAKGLVSGAAMCIRLT